MNYTNELTQAADKLDRILVTCSPGPWVRGGYGDDGWTVHADGGTSADPHLSIETYDSDRGQADADYITTMNPVVAGALTGLFRALAQAGEGRDPALYGQAVIVARAVIEGTGDA